MVTIIIILIVGGVLGYRGEKDKEDLTGKILSAATGGALGFIVGILVAILLSSFAPAYEGKISESKVPLVAMRDSSAVHGNFFLAS